MNLGLLLFFMLVDFGIEKADNNCKLKKGFSLLFRLTSFVRLWSIRLEKKENKNVKNYQRN